MGGIFSKKEKATRITEQDRCGLSYRNTQPLICVQGDPGPEEAEGPVETVPEEGAGPAGEGQAAGQEAPAGRQEGQG